MINIARDSSGRTYQIWKQDQANSCGVACAWMARGIARQMSFGEDEWALACRIYNSAVAGALSQTSRPDPNAPMSLNPRAFRNDQSSFGSTFGNFGLFAGQLASALRSERLKVEHYTNNGNPISVIPNKIAINKPGIALVQWARRGGHFVVIGRAVPSNISFLDPWDGQVVEQANDGTYASNYGNTGILLEILYISA
jgi:hypothetical protein